MNQLDILSLVQEFYAIEAVVAMLSAKQSGRFEPMRHSHNRWYIDFNGFRDDYISKFASAIFDYTALVVAAELRHCADQASQYIEQFYSTRLTRDEVYKDCHVYRARDILKAGLRMFDTVKVQWRSSYGGDKWRQIAKAGLMKGAVSNAVFIDHCVDLSHNCSIYFDKGAGIFYLRNLANYLIFLDLKRDCAPQVLVRTKLGFRFNKLLQRANNLGIIEDKASDGFALGEVFPGESVPCKPVPPDRDGAETALLGYCPINWGDMRLDYSESNIITYACFYDDEDREDDYRYSRCA